MKSKLYKQLVIPFALCALAACSTTPSVSVKTDYDHSAAFGKYHTYALDVTPAVLSPTGTAALRNSLHSSLAARGFTETSIGKADFYVVTTVFTREKLDVIPTGGVTVWPSRYGAYGWRGANVMMNSQVTQYTEGSLVIDFVDRKTHKIIFRGLAQAVVTSTERNAAAIQAAVSKIVAAYPGT